MVKFIRIIAFGFDMFLGFILAFWIALLSTIWLSFVKLPLNISLLIYIIIYLCFVYLFVINRNYIFTNGQSVFQKFFGIEIYYNDALADKKICCKKNLIDFFTWIFGMITIILFNKSIGDLLLDTIVMRKNNK